MSRNLSTTALQSVLSQETGEVWLATLKIDHADMATPIRVVNNTEDIVRADGTYIAFAFDITIPGDTEEEVPEVRLKIDNVDRMIVDEIRSLVGPPDVTLEIILASSPDTVEAGPFNFKLQDVSYNDLTVSGRLGYETDILNEPFPAISFTPNTAQGIF